MLRRLACAIAACFAVLAMSAPATAGVATGRWKGSSIGTDHRLKSIRFNVGARDVVRGVYLRGVKIHCETQNGNFTYRGDFPFRGHDRLGGENGFYLSEPAFGNGTQKVRGHLIDLGVRFRGLVRVHGDYIAAGKDLGDCDSGFIPWRAHEV